MSKRALLKRAAPRRGRPALTCRGPALPELDAAAGDLAGDDPHIDLPLAAGPRPYRGILLQAAQLGRVRPLTDVASALHQQDQAWFYQTLYVDKVRSEAEG